MATTLRPVHDVTNVKPSCPSAKLYVAKATTATGAIRLAQLLEDRRPGLRIVNLHSVPLRYASAFTDLVERLRRRFTLVSPSDLPQLLCQRPVKPSLLFSFDDGLRNTLEVAAPAIEELGATAVFAIPAAWPDVSPDQAPDWFSRHVYPVPTELHAHPGDVEAASWSDLRSLVARGHAVWSHGFDHTRLDHADGAELNREIVESRLRLEAAVGTSVLGFCPPISAGGWSDDADQLIRSTYRYAFSGLPGPLRAPLDPWHLSRTNIEVSWSPTVVDAQLTRFGDMVSRVHARTRT